MQCIIKNSMLFDVAVSTFVGQYYSETMVALVVPRYRFSWNGRRGGVARTLFAMLIEPPRYPFLFIPPFPLFYLVSTAKKTTTTSGCGGFDTYNKCWI